jgi:hypothetical protein
MFVDSLLCDERHYCREGDVSWDHIQQAIRALDNAGMTEVSLARRGTEAHLSITGGGGHYLVSATLDNNIFFGLRSKEGDRRQRIRLVSGRQAVTVGMHEVVSLDVALKVARRFAEAGVIDPEEVWMRNPPE